MSKKPNAQHIILYQLQPYDSSDEKTDYLLHFRADEKAGQRPLKRWLHSQIARSSYHWDEVAWCYTIKSNGKYWLKKLEKSFMMIRGLGE